MSTPQLCHCIFIIQFSLPFSPVKVLQYVDYDVMETMTNVKIKYNVLNCLKMQVKRKSQLFENVTEIVILKWDVTCDKFHLFILF